MCGIGITSLLSPVSTKGCLAAYPLWRFRYYYIVFFEVILLNYLISAGKAVEDNQWWLELFWKFAVPGEYFEIHCWVKERNEQIIAARFGETACFGFPNLKVFNGILTERLIHYLSEKRSTERYPFCSKNIPFYTMHIGDSFSSEDYGTRIVLKAKSRKDKEKIDLILNNINTNINIDQISVNRDNWRLT